MREDDSENALKIKIGQRFSTWRIEKKIDEGGFGQVFKVKNIKTGQFAAFKAESNDIEGGSAIKLEAAVLMLINRKGIKPHVPQLFHAGKRKKFCYMIVTLLGENLRTLRLNCPGERIRPETWSRIAIQCMYCVKLLHDCGYVHRDIKPANFIMGHYSDPERKRIVHILDFGLARQFAKEVGPGIWIARKARATAEFRGTARYCSPAVHERKEQGRKDDIWSLVYLLIEMNCGLPWQKEKDKTKMEIKKLNVSDKVLLMHMPEELFPIIAHLRKLDCYDRPDYFFIYDCLRQLMNRLKVKYSDPYDWETKESISEYLKLPMKKPGWENPSEFFKADPIKINRPPSGRLAEGGKTIEDNVEFVESIYGTQQYSLHMPSHVRTP